MITKRELCDNAAALLSAIADGSFAFTAGFPAAVAAWLRAYSAVNASTESKE